VEDRPAIDLVLRLLSVEAIQLRGEAKDFRTDILGEVVLGEDRLRRVGEGEDRNDVEVAAPRLKLSAA
jgi:hypothetical protein